MSTRALGVSEPCALREPVSQKVKSQRGLREVFQEIRVAAVDANHQPAGSHLPAASEGVGEVRTRDESVVGPHAGRDEWGAGEVQEEMWNAG